MQDVIIASMALCSRCIVKWDKVTKPIEKSQRKSRMISQRDFVMMHFILMGNTSANMRITAMKITCENEEAREKRITKSVCLPIFKTRFKSITSRRKSIKRIPLYNWTMETKISEMLRLRRVIPKTEFLCFLSRHMKIICTKFAMKPRVPVPRYMLDFMIKCVFWSSVSISIILCGIFGFLQIFMIIFMIIFCTGMTHVADISNMNSQHRDSLSFLSTKSSFLGEADALPIFQFFRAWW